MSALPMAEGVPRAGGATEPAQLGSLRDDTRTDPPVFAKSPSDIVG
jgi:hypothetical protein